MEDEDAELQQALLLSLSANSESGLPPSASVPHTTTEACYAAVEGISSAATLKSLLTLIGNVVDNPDEPKFRGPVRKSNAKIQENIVRVNGAADILRCAGFEEDESCFMLRHVDLQCLRRVHGLLQNRERKIGASAKQLGYPVKIPSAAQAKPQVKPPTVKSHAPVQELIAESQNGTKAIEPRVLRLRVRLPLGGGIELSVPSSTTVSELGSLLLERTGIAAHLQRLRFGYPPKKLDAKDEDNLSDVGMHDGEVIILENLHDLFLGNLEGGGYSMSEMLDKLPPTKDGEVNNTAVLFQNALVAFGIGLEERNFWGVVHQRVRRLVTGETKKAEEVAEIRAGLHIVQDLFHNHDPQERLRLLVHCLPVPTRRSGRSKTELPVDRAAFLKSSAPQILKLTQQQLLSPVFVLYKGEAGLDWGGLTRDFFSSFANRLGEDEGGLWQLTGRGALQPTADLVSASIKYPSSSGWRTLKADELYRACGRVFGMAVLHGCKLGRPLSRPFVKLLIGAPPTTLSELQGELNYESSESEPDFRGGQQFLDKSLAENGLEGILTFTRTISDHPELGEIELIPGGAKVQVVEENKAEWLSAVLRHELVTSVQFAATHFRQGLIDVFGGSGDTCPLLCLLGADDLIELWGRGGVDKKEVARWRSVTKISAAIRRQAVWFFEVLEEDYDDETRGKVLQFATGSSSIGREGLPIFIIEPADGGDDRLPSAATCGNMIQLPRYSHKAILSMRVRTAAEMCCSFQML